MPHPRNTPERFWSKVDQSGGLDACWLWQGAIGEQGYGVVRYEGKQWRTHRLAFTLAYGPIEEGALVCHSCDVRACCNPVHLWLGSDAANMEDMRLKGRARYLGGRRGESHRSAKLTEADVLDIRERYAAGGVEQRDLADEYGVHRVQIGSILRGQTWKHVGGPRSTRPDKAGERNPRVRVTETQVREIRARYAAGGVTLTALATEYRIGVSTVYSIISRDSWKHVQ